MLVVATTSTLRQFVEQSPGLLQIGRVEALGEPAVDRHERVAGSGAFSLVAPHPRHARRRAQLERFLRSRATSVVLHRSPDPEPVAFLAAGTWLLAQFNPGRSADGASHTADRH